MPIHLRLRPLIVAVLLGVASSLSACGGDDKPNATPAATVEMGDFWYQPAELTVARDSMVKVVNVGAVAHSWILQAAGVGTAAIAPGRSSTVDLRDVEPGTYRIYCDQAGHTEAGQAGTLTIT